MGEAMKKDCGCNNRGSAIKQTPVRAAKHVAAITGDKQYLTRNEENLLRLWKCEACPHVVRHFKEHQGQAVAVTASDLCGLATERGHIQIWSVDAVSECPDGRWLK